MAATQPASVRVFETHGIDFCCGGKISLADACRDRGVVLEALLAEIDRAASAGAADEKDWTRAGIDSLIDHILDTHHAYLKTQLPRLGAMIEKVRSKHGERHGNVLEPLAGTFGPLRQELESHLAKEETVLFPLIRSLALARDSGIQPPAHHCGSVRNPLRVMLMEHDSAGEALARMRTITDGYAAPADACNTFRAMYWELSELERDLHRHIHLENNILFPRAVELEQGPLAEAGAAR